MWGFDAETTLFGGSMFSFVIGTLFCDEVINPPQRSFGGNPNRIVSASDSDQNWKKRTKGSMSHILKKVFQPFPKNANMTYVISLFVRV